MEEILKTEKEGLVTLFSSSNGTVNVYQIDPKSTTQTLEPAMYVLNYSMMSGFYLQKQDLPKLPPKIYGTHSDRANRIINTYRDRAANGKSTGVLLVGSKGQGKTMLTELTAQRCIDAGTPVILINSAFDGVSFAEFLNLLGDVVIIFDEFAKTYGKDPEKQDGLLTIFDGTMSRPRLILITENDYHRINQFLKDRPGRMFYRFTYGKLEVDVIEEVCLDMGVSPILTKQIIGLSSNINGFSMDMLKAIIEEHKRYPSEAITDIVTNINISTSDSIKYNTEIVKFVVSKDVALRTDIRNIAMDADKKGFSYEYLDEDEEVATWRKTHQSVSRHHSQSQKGELHYSTYLDDSVQVYAKFTRELDYDYVW